MKEYPTLLYENILYTVDNPFKDQLIKRGIPIIYDLSDEEDEWLVIDAFIFWSARIQKFIIAPRWFVTDLASIPKPVRSVISVNGRHRYPAIFHDVLYTLADKGFCTKREADLVFKDLMKYFNVPEWKVYSMYYAVVIGGDSSWNNKGKCYAPLDHRYEYTDSYPKLMLSLTDGGFT